MCEVYADPFHNFNRCSIQLPLKLRSECLVIHLLLQVSTQMMVKLLSGCKRGTEPQGIVVDYCYLFRRQCLSIKFIALKKVYLVTHCHYETKSTITVNIFDILAGTLLVAEKPC